MSSDKKVINLAQFRVRLAISKTRRPSDVQATQGLEVPDLLVCLGDPLLINSWIRERVHQEGTEVAETQRSLREVG
jgi:hypothetical protein